MVIGRSEHLIWATERGASVAALCLLAGAAFGQAPVTYVDHVRPIFAARCLNCHNADKMRGDLDLSSYSGVMTGSSGGAVVEAGNADGSALYGVVMRTREPFMPPKGDKLPDAELEVIRTWIAGGAKETASSKAVAARPAVSLGAAAEGGAAYAGPMRMPLETLASTGRAGAVLAMAAHPGSAVVAFGDQGQVLVYDLERRGLVGALDFRVSASESGDVVRQVRFSRDGGLVLAAGGSEGMRGYVKVWSVPDGEPVLTLGDEVDVVLAADLHARRERLAIGGPSKIVKVLAVADGKVLGRVTKHTDWITAVAYSPDGVLLATADRAGGILVWEAESMAPYQALAGHQAAVTSLDWSPDSNVLVSAGEDGRVRLWEMNEGRMIKEWAAHAGGALSVRVASDGSIVTSGRDNSAKLWKGDGTLVRTFPTMGSLVLGAALDSTRTRVVGADLSGGVAVWNAADGAVLGTLNSNPGSLSDRLAAAQKRADGVREIASQASGNAAKAAEALAAAERSAQAAAGAIATAEDTDAKARATLASAQATASAARQEAERSAAASAAAAGVLAAAGSEVERLLSELKAGVETDLTLQGELTRERSEYSRLENEASEASRLAAASDDPAKRAAADSASAAAAGAREALGRAQKAATDSSARVRTMLDESEKAKSAHTQAAASADAAAIAAKSAKDAEAVATQAEGAATSVAQAAAAALESARAAVAETAERVAQARDAAAQTARVRDAAVVVALDAERELARCLAGTLRQELDAARAELATIESDAAPAVAKAGDSKAVSDRAAAALDEARREVAALPARLEQLAGVAKAAADARASATAAAAGAAALAESRKALRSTLAAVVEQVRADAAKSPQDAGLAAGAAKAAESLQGLDASLAAAEAEAQQASAAADAAAKAEADAIASCTRAKDAAEALPARVAALEAEAKNASELAAADQAAADTALAPATPLRQRIGSLRARYAEQLAAAEK